MRGGTQPTSSGTYRGRACRGWLVGLGRRAEPWACSASGRALGASRFCTRFLSPLKKIPTARFRGQLLSPVAPRRAVRAPMSDTEAPSRWKTCSMDATWASCRSPVGPAGSYHRHRLRRSPGHLCSWFTSCTPLGAGLPLTRWPNTAAPHRPAAPDRRDASPFDRRRCGRP